MLVNAAAYVVIVVGGVTLELLASNTTVELAGDHQVIIGRLPSCSSPLLG
jgi:hypothetical protein